MAGKETDEYSVGQFGWIEAADCDGEEWHWLQGKIVRLIPGEEETLWALIDSHRGTILCRLS